MKDLVYLNGDQPVTTSLKVAEYFEKRHDNVITAIRASIQALLNFKDSEKAFRLTNYIDETGKSNPMYELNRDGFMFVAMGFTGKKATALKWNYIQAFNAMEQELTRLLIERRNAEWQEIYGSPNELERVFRQTRRAFDSDEEAEKVKALRGIKTPDAIWIAANYAFMYDRRLGYYE